MQATSRLAARMSSTAGQWVDDAAECGARKYARRSSFLGARSLQVRCISATKTTDRHDRTRGAAWPREAPREPCAFRSLGHAGEAMRTSSTIEDVVARFMNDLLDILYRAKGERHSDALTAIAAMLSEHRIRSKPSVPPVRKPSARKTPARHKKALPASKAPSAPTPPHRSRHPRMIAVPAGTQVAARVPGVDSGLTPSPSPEAHDDAHDRTLPEVNGVAQVVDRETLVLDAVRTLIRPTAGEIAQQCGLPNGSAYVVLRALVASGRVAKIEAARGQEYSLTSTGGIRPFKRSKERAPEPAPSASTATGPEPPSEAHDSSAA